MTQSVLLAVAGGIATIEFNRPELFNAMDSEMMIQFRAAAELVQKDPAFAQWCCAGAARHFWRAATSACFIAISRELPDIVMRMGREMHFAILALRRAAKPVLASVHGAVAGAGFSIFCAADLAIAADNAKFSLAYANIGTSPDGGSTYHLPRLLGYKKAMELTLLPDLFDAAAAKELGLVNWVVAADQLEAQTQQIATRLANGPTAAYGESKRLLYQSFDRSIETQMEDELVAFAGLARNTRDLAEGVAAFVEKRKPDFKGE